LLVLISYSSTQRLYWPSSSYSPYYQALFAEAQKPAPTYIQVMPHYTPKAHNVRDAAQAYSPRLDFRIPLRNAPIMSAIVPSLKPFQNSAFRIVVFSPAYLKFSHILCRKCVLHPWSCSFFEKEKRKHCKITSKGHFRDMGEWSGIDSL
uniref:Secreted protein n=1 Tax=Haemonchus placei TaxID=6290 RepID=A0A0N4X5J8_HAEPC